MRQGEGIACPPRPLQLRQGFAGAVFDRVDLLVGQERLKVGFGFSVAAEGGETARQLDLRHGQAVLALGIILVDRQHTAEQGFAGGWISHLPPDLRHLVERHGEGAVLGAVDLLVDREHAGVEPQGLVQAAGFFVEAGELVEGAREVGVVGAEHGFGRRHAVLEAGAGRLVVPAQIVGAAEAVEGRDDQRMIRAEGRFADRQRPSKVGDRSVGVFLIVAPHDEQGAQRAQDVREDRVVRAIGALEMRQRPLVVRPSRGAVPMVAQGVAQLDPRRGRVRVIGSEALLQDLQGALEPWPGGFGVKRFQQRVAEVPQGQPDLGVPWTERGFEDGQRALLVAAGRREVALGFEHPAQADERAPHVRPDIRLIGAESRFADRQRFLVERPGRLVLGSLGEHPGEPMERGGKVQPVFARQAAPDVHGPFEERLRLVIKREVPVDVAHHCHQVGLQLRLVRQLGLDPRRAVVEELAGGDLLAARLGRRRHLEQPAQEARHLGGPRRREPRPVALAGQLDRVGRCQGRDEQQGRRCRADRRQVAPHELAGAVGPGVRPRGDGPAFQVALDVGDHRRHRSIAPFGFLAQSGEHDRVEVAGQLAAQAHGRRASRSGDLLGRLRLAARRPATSGRRVHRGRGARRLFSGDRPFHLAGPAAVQVIGEAAGEQQVEEQTELVDVRRRGHRVAPKLLGARVGRGHQPRGQEGDRRHSGRRGVRSEELGDAEVEELGVAVRRDQDVRGLDVPVHHQAAVRGFGRPGYLDEQAEPLGCGQPLLVAIGVDGAPFHELHYQVRPAAGTHAAVEEPGEAGVPGEGQDLALLVEPPHQLVGVEPAFQELQRHPLLELAVGALGEEDHSHAAAPQLANDPVAPHDLAGREAAALLQVALGAVPERPLEGAPGRERRSVRLGAGQEPLDQRAQLGVATAGAVEEGGALRRGEIEGFVEDLVGATPAVFGGVPHPPDPSPIRTPTLRERGEEAVSEGL